MNNCSYDSRKPRKVNRYGQKKPIIERTLYFIYNIRLMISRRGAPMAKIDPIVKKETGYIALFVIILSMAMEAVFLVIGKWDLKVLFGNLLGGGTAILNFFLMGLTLQAAVGKDQKDAAARIKFSQTYRMLMLFAVAGAGVLAPIFNMVATIVPLFFPRIAIALRPLIDKNKGGDADAQTDDTKTNDTQETDDVEEDDGI